MKSRVSIIAVFVLAVLIPFYLSGDAFGAFPGVNGKITFSSNRDGDHEIYLVYANGTGTIRLTSNTFSDTGPSFSSNGTKIVFTSNRDGNLEIYTMNSDGTGQTRLTSNMALDISPSWSPDGTKIVFQSNRDGNDEIYVMNSDGSAQTRLTTTITPDQFPTFSPDGTKITFSSNRDGNQEIYVMNSDGSAQTRLTTNTFVDAISSFSPDGTQIVFSSDRDNPSTFNYEIYAMKSDGNNPIRLTTNTALDSQASFSPDGKQIVFTSNRDGNDEIYIMEANGGPAIRLTTNTAQDNLPNWQPGFPKLVSISDESITEGDSGTINAGFVVALSNPSSQTVTVNYATSSNTATSPSDYTTTTGTLTFLPGQTKGIITVPIKGDALDESDETFTVTLSSPNGASITDGTAIGTIIDNDPAPSISISDATPVTEGNSGTTNAQFTVSLSNPSSQTITIDFATSDGIATSPSDYTTTTGILTFSPGSITRTILIPIKGDTLDEYDETFNVVISNPTNASILDNTGVVTILSDGDIAPGISVSDVFITESDEDSTVDITITLDGQSGKTITGFYDVVSGTAIAGDDFIPISPAVQFTLNPGETSTAFPVTVKGDLIDEPPQFFTVRLLGPVVGSFYVDNSATGTIIDNDPTPKISVSPDIAVPEGDIGNVDHSFLVTLDAPSESQIVVDYYVLDGTANRGSDFFAPTFVSPGRLIFNANEISKPLTVTIIPDTKDETDESLTINLIGSSSQFTDGSQTVTILDDDPTPLISIPDVNFGERDQTTSVTLQVSLSAISGLPVSVDYATSDGTAQSSDYVQTNGRVTIPAGQFSTSVLIPLIKPDFLDEPDETIFITLSNPINGEILDDIGIVTINDDDPAPSISISDATPVTEGNSGTTPTQFTVTLSTPSGKITSVNYYTSSGTASADSDFTLSSGTLIFAPGETSKTIDVLVNGDTTYEPNEQFSVYLSTPVDVILSDLNGIGVITNDDFPSISISDVDINELGPFSFTNAIFIVSLSEPAKETISVNYATSDDTATSSDYGERTGTLTFEQNQQSKQIQIGIFGDAIYEPDEIFNLVLSDPSKAVISDDTGIGTIINDDPIPTISISNAPGVIEGNSGTTNAQFTVTISNPSSETMTVNYETFSGTAVMGTDFVESSNTLTFTPGEISKTIDISVNGDDAVELTEYFSVRISGPVNAEILENEGIGTIITDDFPSASISDITMTEGNPGSASMTFMVNLSEPALQQISINFATSDDTAEAGSDYTSSSGIVTFAPGDTSKIITVPVRGDYLDEPDETFTVTLSPFTQNISILDGIGTGIIIDDDPTPTISISDATVTEGNSGTTNAQFRVFLSNPSSGTITVDYDTDDVSATLANNDYTTASGTLTFAPEETSKTIDVLVNGDADEESNEIFNMILSNNSPNSSIIVGTATGTINDDDTQISISDAIITEGDFGITSAQFTVSLSRAYSQTILVNYATSDDTAEAGSDYTSSSGIVTFAPGDTSRIITVPMRGDYLDEPDETFTVTLSNNSPNSSILVGTATGTIIDNDPTPSLSITDATVTEGNSGTTTAQFTVSLSAPSGQTVSVDYATNNVSATLADNDYTAASGTITFTPGQTTQTVNVLVNGDTVDEPNESFSVELSNPTNANISDGLSTITILNDERTISISDSTVTEGESGSITTGSFTVTLSNPSSEPTTVNFVVSDITTSSDDYLVMNSPLVIPAGEITRDIYFSVIDNNIYEPDETLTVTLSGATNTSILVGTATGTIIDNDPIPSISITDSTVTEGNSGTTTAQFTISLSNPSTQTITVNYATSVVTAESDTDYTTSSGTLTFAPGETSKTIDVLVNGDTNDEPNETFTVTLSGATNASIIVGTATGTINDDDGIISISDAIPVIEGNSGTTNAQFTVSLSNQLSQAVSVDYTTSDDTAEASSDYTTASGTLTFAPGETSKTIDVLVNGDTNDEPDETFTVTLSNPVGITISNSVGTATIIDDDLFISIADVMITEGTTGSSMASFVVTLSKESPETVTVQYSTLEGTALGSNGFSSSYPYDYTTTSGTLTFQPGEITKTIDVAIRVENWYESDETFTALLSNPIKAAISDGTAIGTILNDDTLPSITIFDASHTETDSGSSVSIPVSLSAISQIPIQVNYVTSDGTAEAGSDYTAASGTLTFPTDFNLALIQIPITGDLTIEQNENFFVTISNPTPTDVVIVDNQATVTISDNDTPILSINNPSILEGDTGTTNIAFNIVLSKSSPQAVIVDYSTFDGSAIQPSDYALTSGTLTFAPGETSKTIDIAINGDAQDEQNETFTVRLSNLAGAFFPPFSPNPYFGTATILNDDTPKISIKPVTIKEGDAGTTQAQFELSLSKTSSNFVSASVNVAPEPGSALHGPATAGVDYSYTWQPVSFSPGQTTIFISVDIIGDTTTERTELVRATLSNPLYAILDPSGSSALLYIENDDGPSISINDLTITEGDSGTKSASLTLTLSEPSSNNVYVEIAPSGTATLPSDWFTMTRVASFLPGQLETTYTINVVGDTLVEPDETAVITLINPAFAKILDTQGIVTIQNDDDASPVLDVIGAKTVNELQTLSFTATAADLDTPASSLAFSLGPTAPAGAQITTGGQFSWTPTESDGGQSFTFDVIVSDGTATDSETITVTVVEVNLAPNPVNDSLTTPEDVPLVLDVSDLISNDSDPDGDMLIVTEVASSINGLVVLDGSTITFTPDANFEGNASFEYVVSDGFLTGTGLVTVNVTPVNDAPVADPQSVTTAEDESISIVLSGSDVDDTVLSFVVLDPPTKGILFGTAPNLTYTPNNDANGPDSFTFKINDGELDSNIATISISITPVNDPPTASTQSISVDEDTSISITLSGTDDDLDALSFTISNPPDNGILSGIAPTLTYTPNPNYHGIDSFEFVSNDGQENSVPADVFITVNPVNDLPTAMNDPANTPEDTSVVIDVLSNDEDIDGDALSVIAITTLPSRGTALINGDNTITYVPQDNHNGIDSFVYKISDGNGGEHTATVSVDIGATNDGPVAVDDFTSTSEDDSITINVVSNDLDVDNDALVISATTVPSSGTITNNGDGTISYSPNPNYHGTDSFQYTITDGYEFDDAIVSITINPVNDAPISNSDAFGVDEDSTLIISTLGILANDVDVDSALFSAVIVSSTTNGDLTLDPDGSFTYLPNPNYHGTDSFTYVTNDGETNSAPATVSLIINPVNDTPIVVDDTTSTQEDIPLEIPALSLIGNDQDVDLDALTITSVQTPINGMVTLDGSTITFTPDANFEGNASFEYVVSDGFLTGTGLVTVNVTPVNDAPTIASIITQTIAELTTLTIPVAANDVDGDLLTFDLIGEPSGMSISGTGTISWMPNESQGPGSYTFDVSASDGTQSDLQSVTVIVNEINANPSLNAINSQSITAGDMAMFTAFATDMDIPAQTLVYNLNGAPIDAMIDANTGEFSWQTSASDAGQTYSFQVHVSDGVSTTSTNVSITVNAANGDADNDGISDAVEIALTGSPNGLAMTLTGDVSSIQAILDPITGKITLQAFSSSGGSLGIVTLPPGSTASANVVLDVDKHSYSSSILRNGIELNGISVPATPGKTISLKKLASASDIACIVDSVGFDLAERTDVCSHNPAQSEVRLSCPAGTTTTRTVNGFPSGTPSSRTYTCTQETINGESYMTVTGLAYSTVMEFVDANNDGTDDAAQLYCDGKTIPQLLATPGYNIIDNRDGHLGAKIKGTNGNDLILLSDVSTKVSARQGNDCVIGGAGNDDIQGNKGNDQIFGNGGNDKIAGNEGDDALNGGDGDDKIHGGKGNDIILGGSGSDKIQGHAGSDNLSGDEGDDKIHGGKDDDAVSGGLGSDALHGHQGADTLNGNEGDDKIHGGQGNDTIDGGSGNNKCNGGAGNNTVMNCTADNKVLDEDEEPEEKESEED